MGSGERFSGIKPDRKKPSNRFTPGFWTPPRLIFGFFIVLITLGSFLLWLPISTNSGQSPSLLTAVFTSTSAASVTGLMRVDTGVYWSGFGQVVILLLVQLGGLGFASSAILVLLGMRTSFNLTGRLAIQSATGTLTRKDVLKLSFFVIKVTLFCELLGAFLLFLGWVGDLGVPKAAWWGLFHSVTAFNNVGYDLAGTPEAQFVSMIGYSNNYIVVYVLMALIFMGSIGFLTISEVLDYRRTRRLSVQSKVVLSGTAVIIVAGSLIFWLIEFNNPQTLGPMIFPQQASSALFQSIAPRTGGMNTVNLAALSTPGYLLIVALMLIGGGSGSTAGGIKVSTTLVILASLRSILRNREATVLFKRTVPQRTVSLALAVGSFYVIGVSLVTFLIAVFDPQLQLRWILFDVVSAFCTVGLSLGATPLFSETSQILLIFAMLAGRLGPLVLFLAISRSHPERFRVRFPEEDVSVG